MKENDPSNDRPKVNKPKVYILAIVILLVVNTIARWIITDLENEFRMYLYPIFPYVATALLAAALITAHLYIRKRTKAPSLKPVTRVIGITLIAALLIWLTVGAIIAAQTVNTQGASNERAEPASITPLREYEPLAATEEETVQPTEAQPAPAQQSSPSTHESNCYTSDEAWNNIGATGCVIYHVASPYRSSEGDVFLNEKHNYSTGFVGVVFRSSGANAGAETSWGNKTIEVSGQISLYEGHPQIVVESNSQVKVVD